MPVPQNGQTHSNISSAIADELFVCVWSNVGLALNGLTILTDLLLYHVSFCEKCPNSEFFLEPNAGEAKDQKNLQIRTLLSLCLLLN